MDPQFVQTHCATAQLVAVLTALKILNIVSDSTYVVHTVQNIEMASIS